MTCHFIIIKYNCSTAIFEKKISKFQGEWNIEEALQSSQGIDPSPGMRSYSEVDEVLEEEKIDDEIEEYVIQERLARETKWKNPFKPR